MLQLTRLIPASSDYTTRIEHCLNLIAHLEENILAFRIQKVGMQIAHSVRNVTFSEQRLEQFLITGVSSLLFLGIALFKGNGEDSAQHALSGEGEGDEKIETVLVEDRLSQTEESQSMFTG